MMSNNFVELKGAVFKKFAKPNLFQMSCRFVMGRRVNSGYPGMQRTPTNLVTSASAFTR